MSTYLSAFRILPGKPSNFCFIELQKYVAHIFIKSAMPGIVLWGCAGPPQATNVRLTPNPNENAPLAGILSYTADRPVTTTLLIDDGISRQTIHPDDSLQNSHEVMVLGLKPGRHHTVLATITDADGNESVLDTMEIETPPLPEDFPPIELAHNAPGILEPGVTMFSVFRWVSAFEDDADWAYAVAIDSSGEVVWYLKAPYWVDEVRRSRDGNLLFAGNEDGRLYEIDMLGNTIREWHTTGAVIKAVPDASIPVDTDTFHHDVLQIANGNFIGLGLEVRTLENFPAEYPPSTKQETANVAGDVIIEFTPEGTTLRKWSMVDILDPRRLGEGSLSRGHYEEIYKDRYDPAPYDITHCNAIYYIEDEDAVLVSSNFQCAIYKVDMKTGELLWILGDPTGWEKPWADKLLKPKGELVWPCHQHGLELTPQGTLLFFDNGGGRFIPPNEPMALEDRYSRALELRVDEEAGTVEEVWAYGPRQERFVSPFISDADYLPETGNILIADGGRFLDENGGLMPTFGGHQWARILEVTKEPQPKKLWEVQIKDPKVRYSIYRGQRFKSLYPKQDRPTG